MHRRHANLAHRARFCHGCTFNPNKINDRSGSGSQIRCMHAKGIGTRLVLEGLKTLKTKSMVKATVDTEDNNPTKAVKLYEKVGFKVAQEYLTYEKSL